MMLIDFCYNYRTRIQSSVSNYYLKTAGTQSRKKFGHFCDVFLKYFLQITVAQSRIFIENLMNYMEKVIVLSWFTEGASVYPISANFPGTKFLKINFRVANWLILDINSRHYMFTFIKKRYIGWFQNHTWLEQIWIIHTQFNYNYFLMSRGTNHGFWSKRITW